MADALHKLATSTEKAPLQRVPLETNKPQTAQVQRVIQETTITTSTNPTAKAILQTKQRTHLRTTQNIKPGAVPLIPVHKKTCKAITSPQSWAVFPNPIAYDLLQTEFIADTIFQSIPHYFPRSSQFCN